MLQALDTATNKLRVWLDSTQGRLHTLAVSNLELLSNQGKVFTGTHIFTSLANDAFINILMSTGALQTLVGISIDPVGDFQSWVFEGTTVSAAGSALPAVNFNRPASVANPTSLTTVTLEPTITEDGLQLVTELILGGTKKDAIGASSERVGIEKSSELYLFRFQNQSGQNSKGTIGWIIGEL